MSKSEADLETAREADDDDSNTADLPLLEMKPPKSASWSLPGFPKRYRTQLERTSSCKQRPLTILRYLVLTLLATIGIASLVMRLVKHIQGPESGYQKCYCGSSIQEAIEKGCKFDLLGPSWAPDHCRDDALTAEFLKAGPGPIGTWEFWWVHEHTMRMSIEEVSLLPGQRSPKPASLRHGASSTDSNPDTDGAFYGAWEFHVKHCTYQWRKHTRGLMRGRTTMDAENVGLGHIQHCEGMILRQLPVRAKIPLNVPHLGWEPYIDHDDLHTSTDMDHSIVHMQ